MSEWSERVERLLSTYFSVPRSFSSEFWGSRARWTCILARSKITCLPRKVADGSSCAWFKAIAAFVDNSLLDVHERNSMAITPNISVGRYFPRLNLIYILCVQNGTSSFVIFAFSALHTISQHTTNSTAILMISIIVRSGKELTSKVLLRAPRWTWQMFMIKKKSLSSSFF